jgi:hypothetical protein
MTIRVERLPERCGLFANLDENIPPDLELSKLPHGQEAILVKNRAGAKRLAAPGAPRVRRQYWL